MAAQTYAGPVRWVVVDDGPEPQPVTFRREGWELVVIRPSPFWQPGQNTQARNMLAGLAAIEPGAALVCIEDDDWYARDWLAHVAAELRHDELVGETHARYYNVATRVGRQLTNAEHSSLCSTAVRGSALGALRDACRTGARWIDIDLWKRGGHLFGGHRVVGIKGLPGRGGIGMGHDRAFRGQADPDGRLLREWIGGDADAYLRTHVETHHDGSKIAASLLEMAR